MNKPLSKAERELIKAAEPSYAIVDRLLSAEAYWREAVKNASFAHWSTQCPFCDASSGVHAEECAWLIAQEPDASK